MKKKIVWESQHIEEDIQDDEDDELGFEDDEVMMPKMGSVMATPFGMYSVNDSTSNPYKLFEIWVGHTNFPISEQVVLLLSETPGVEVLRILSPYRFLVAPGRLFDWRDVATLIQNRLCKSQYVSMVQNLPENIRDSVLDVVNTSLKDKDFWRLYVFPNGNVYHKPYERLVDYNEGKKEFDELKTASNGILITSD